MSRRARKTVRYADAFLDRVQARFPESRASGDPDMTWGEFFAGPVRTAVIQFRDHWDDQPPAAGEAVRIAWVAPRVVGPVVFYGVLVAPDTVEIRDFEVDDGYWDQVRADPDH